MSDGEIVNPNDERVLLESVPSMPMHLFDLDGVVANTEALHHRAEKAVCREMGVAEDVIAWSSYVGVPDRILFADIIHQHGLTGVSVSTLCQLKQQRYLHELESGQIHAIAGVVSYLKHLVANERSIALVTSSGKPHQQAVCRKLGVDKYFTVIVTADDVEQGKPHPEPYLTAVALLTQSMSTPFLATRRLASRPVPQGNGWAGRRVVYEDSINGVKAAKAADCFVVGVSTSFSEKQLRAAGADLIVCDFHTLLYLSA